MEVVSNVSSVTEKRGKTALFSPAGESFFSLAAGQRCGRIRTSKQAFESPLVKGSQKCCHIFGTHKPLTSRARVDQIALARFDSLEAVEERVYALVRNAPPYGGANARRMVAGAKAAPRAAKFAVNFAISARGRGFPPDF